MLQSLGLSEFYWTIGENKDEPLFDRHSRHFSNANEKLKKYYTKKIALKAYEILEIDYRILGFDFPFPEYIAIKVAKRV